MQIILLATDAGHKLSPLTDRMPAALLPVVDRPVLAVALEILVRAGYKRPVVSLHHCGSIVSCLGDGRRWGAKIEYMVQRENWGSAGAVRWAARALDTTCLVLPADMIHDLRIEEALAYHYAHGQAATAIVHAPRSDATPRPVCVDASGRVRGLPASPGSAETLWSTGAYIFEPAALRFIPPRTYYECYDHLLPALLDAGLPVYGYHSHGYWNPLESLPAYQEAQRVFLYSAYQPDGAGDDESPRVRYPSIDGQQIAPGVWAGAYVKIHPAAQLAPPIYLGDHCLVQAGAELGPETVIGADVAVDCEATVLRSTILGQTYIGKLVNVADRIVTKSRLIDPQTAESAEIVDPFLLAEIVVPERRGYARRSTNIVVALLLLLAALPLALVVGLAILLAYGGPVIVRSPRVGRRPRSGAQGEAGEPPRIDLLAFRTCRADGSQGALGRWVRELELDRLPELLHVLRGDLDLVGVRPLCLEQAAQLHEAWHRQRYTCAVGFTGLWYVQVHPAADLDEVLVADVYYAATRTWLVDVALLAKTPLAWLRRRRRSVADETVRAQSLRQGP